MMMMTEAKINREYALRIIGVGALMVGICLWSLYDGMVAWPRCNQEMEQVRPMLVGTNLTAEAWFAQEEEGSNSLLAKTFATQNVKPASKLVRKLGELRLSDSVPDRDAARAAQLEQVHKLFEKPVYSDHDLQTQFVQATITLLLGLWAFAVVGLKARKRFVADDNGLSGNGIGTQPIAYGDIKTIDWAKWDEKGIVKLTLNTGGRLTLDAWHFAGIKGIVDGIVKRRPELAQQEEAEGNKE